MNPHSKSLILATALLATSFSWAGGVRMYEKGEIPDASEVANILGGQKRPKMRGISLDPAYQKTTEAKDAIAEKAAEPSSDVLGLPVEFAFNSAEILPEAKPQLDAIAEGIKMTNGAKIIIEGHTDASGSAAYNKQLSLRRARAVKDYLVRKHGISPQQLVIRGLGESDPLNPADPFAPENRRVQFRAAR